MICSVFHFCKKTQLNLFIYLIQFFYFVFFICLLIFFSPFFFFLRSFFIKPVFISRSCRHFFLTIFSYSSNLLFYSHIVHQLKFFFPFLFRLSGLWDSFFLWSTLQSSYPPRHRYVHMLQLHKTCHRSKKKLIFFLIFYIFLSFCSMYKRWF